MTDILQCTPMRAAETNTRPAFAMPPGACDTHFHVFEPGYPHVPEPLYTFPDGTIDQYLAMAEALGIQRMVLVQPSFYGTDNSLLRHVLKRLGPRCGGVVQIDEDASDAELDEFHELGVRAIRLDLFARASWPAAELVAYIQRMAARAAPRGWHLQFYTPGAIVRDLLPFLADLEDTFVIDRPWVVDGQLAVRKVTELTLAFDHRACDGGTAGGFLRYVADCVESPVAALGDM